MTGFIPPEAERLEDASPAPLSPESVQAEPAEPTLSLVARLEALLFVASNPATPQQLAAALDVPTPEVERGLAALESAYADSAQERGLRLQRHHGRVQLTTAPQATESVERFLGLDVTTHLSRAALEALAIVAYQQPVTRPQMDSVRGVNSDGVLKSLLSKGLIEEVGRAEAPGRPILYATTPEFLQYFGLNALENLPPLNLEGRPPQVGERAQDERARYERVSSSDILKQ